MASQKWFRRYTLTLANNGDTTIQRTGRQIVVVSATADFLLGIDDETPGEISQGFKVETEPGEIFSRVRVRNESGASNTIVLSIGFGNVIDGRLSLTAPILVAGASAFVSVADVSLATVTAGEIFVANADRRQAIINNPSGNVGIFHIGDSGVGVAEGIELLPGQTLVLDTAGSVWAFNTGAGTESLKLSEVRNA